MVGFSYTYSTPQTFLSNGISGGEIAWIILIIAMMLIAIFIVLPTCIITYKNIKDIKQKKQKKRMLNQILIQKEIENEIEKEIKLDGKTIEW